MAVPSFLDIVRERCLPNRRSLSFRVFLWLVSSSESLHHPLPLTWFSFKQPTLLVTHMSRMNFCISIFSIFLHQMMSPFFTVMLRTLSVHKTYLVSFSQPRPLSACLWHHCAELPLFLFVYTYVYCFSCESSQGLFMSVQPVIPNYVVSQGQGLYLPCPLTLPSTGQCLAH